MRRKEQAAERGPVTGVPANDMETAPRLPPEMQDRPDARELREFVLTYLSIGDPAERRRILEAVENAAS